MTPNEKYGRTEIAPVTIIPTPPIDLSEEHPAPSKPGRAEAPVHVVPGPTVDFGAAAPALQLRLTFRAGATPLQVAEDLCRLFIALNQFDHSQQGSGLLPEEISREITTSNGVFLLTLRSAEPNGAAERLARVVSAINLSQGYPSLQHCEARLVSSAA